MNNAITKFLQKQTCASIACTNTEGHPYSFSCFYVFNPEMGYMYFKSSELSLHSKFLAAHPEISGTVLPDQLRKLSIMGVQLEGICLSDEAHDASAASQYYHKKNPMALAMQGKVWTILINHIKLTDNSLGFGKKIHWNREAIDMQ